jgi:hypothetical protein
LIGPDDRAGGEPAWLSKTEYKIIAPAPAADDKIKADIEEVERITGFAISDVFINNPVLKRFPHLRPFANQQRYIVRRMKDRGK